MSAVDRVTEAARALGLEIDVKEFPEGTRTAEDAARAVGCDVSQIVKTLVFVAGDEPVIAFVSGRHKLDVAKLASAAGVNKVRRASPDEAKSWTGFAIGGTPPFGYVRSFDIFLDETLLDFEQVWCAAGTDRTVFALDPSALLQATGARVENLHEEPL